MRKDCIHITHNDSDAIGCALVAALVNPDYELLKNTVFCSATNGSDKLNEIMDSYEAEGKEIPDLIIISDISVTEDACIRLEGWKRKNPNLRLLGYDHHPTNHLNENFKWFKVLSTPIYDMDDSGQRLQSATKIMFNDILIKYPELYAEPFIPKLKELVNMISRYDTWSWKNFPVEEQIYPFLEDIIAVICNFNGPYETFRDLLSMYEEYRREGCFKNSPLVPSLFEELYRVEKNNEAKYMKTIDTKVRVFKNGIYLVGLFFNETNYSNAACEYLYTLYPDIDIFVVIYPSSSQLGFRTSNKDINLGEIAKKYFNGGGHKQAAGAKLDDKQMAEVMDTFYNKAIKVKDYDWSK